MTRSVKLQEEEGGPNEQDVVETDGVESRPLNEVTYIVTVMFTQTQRSP